MLSDVPGLGPLSGLRPPETERGGGSAFVLMTIRTLEEQHLEEQHLEEQHLDLQPKPTPADGPKWAQASRTSCQFNRYLTSVVLKEAQHFFFF